MATPSERENKVADAAEEKKTAFMTNRLGPLSFDRRMEPTSREAHKEGRARAASIMLEPDAQRADLKALRKLLEALNLSPRSADVRESLDRVYTRLDPARVSRSMSLEDFYGQISQELFIESDGACARAPYDMRQCFLSGQEAITDKKQAMLSPQAARPMFELLEPSLGIVTLVVRDLSASNDDSLAKILPRIAAARGLLIDMSGAQGDNPLPILPLLKQVTGLVKLKPLRAISRPPQADDLIAAYKKRFEAKNRDDDAWSALVGKSSPPERSKQRVTVLVGDGCGPACELSARVLVTYADAKIYGGVRHHDRLHRANPAVMLLPRSKIEIYFFASEYVLDPRIQKATGPIGNWRVGLQERYNGDLAAYAIAELEAQKKPRRCSSYRGYSKVQHLPVVLTKKLPGAGYLQMAHSWQISQTIEANAPYSAVKRFADTCGKRILLRARGYSDTIGIETNLTLVELSRLAQSDLIEYIQVTYHPPDELHSD